MMIKTNLISLSRQVYGVTNRSQGTHISVLFKQAKSNTGSLVNHVYPISFGPAACMRFVPQQPHAISRPDCFARNPSQEAQAPGVRLGSGHWVTADTQTRAPLAKDAKSEVEVMYG